MSETNTPDTNVRKSWAKQLLQDIEESNIDPRLVTLDSLTTQNSLFYGSKNSNNAAVKDKRKKLSKALHDLKRVIAKSPASYETICVKNKVKLGANTKALVLLEKEGKDFSVPNSKVIDNKIEDYIDDLDALEIDDAQEFDAFDYDNSSLFTPPRKNTMTTPPRATRSNTSRIDLTPPRNQTPLRPQFAMSPDPDMPKTILQPVSSVASVLSDTPMTITQHQGAEYNPDLFFFAPGSNGRYTNGYNVFQPFKLEKKAPNGPKIGYKGALFIYKKVDPTDLLEHSAALPSRAYLDKLVSLQVLTEEQACLPCILFKSPSVESGDRVGNSAKFKIFFPCEESKKEVAALHANVKDSSSSRYWYYTLGLFALEDGKVFDNRIFSNHDYEIERFESTPPPEKAIGEESTLNWHAMWRIAISKTGELIEEETAETLEDIMKKRRAQFGGP